MPETGSGNSRLRNGFSPGYALAFIAFSTWEFVRFSPDRKNGGKVITITVFEAPGASIPVFPVSFFVLKLNPAFPLFFIPPFSGIIFCFRYTLTGDVLRCKMYFEEVRE